MLHNCIIWKCLIDNDKLDVLYISNTSYSPERGGAMGSTWLEIAGFFVFTGRPWLARIGEVKSGAASSPIVGS